MVNKEGNPKLSDRELKKLRDCPEIEDLYKSILKEPTAQKGQKSSKNGNGVRRKTAKERRKERGKESREKESFIREMEAKKVAEEYLSSDPEIQPINDDKLIELIKKAKAEKEKLDQGTHSSTSYSVSSGQATAAPAEEKGKKKEKPEKEAVAIKDPSKLVKLIPYMNDWDKVILQNFIIDLEKGRIDK